METVRTLKIERYRQGQKIITQGEDGDSFYIVGNGQVSVIKENIDGSRHELEVLLPGDSFGEIALVENITRTATVQALSEVMLLVLSKKMFNQLFSDESKERKGLTDLIRKVKLVMESQALSHLTSVQMRELLAVSERQSFKPSQIIIEKDSIGDCAYLVENGHVDVMRSTDGEKISTSSRGALIGAIALVKNIPRTASVVARDEVTCLKFTKDVFLKVCMSNIFVAMLVSDLTEKQLSELKVS